MQLNLVALKIILSPPGLALANPRYYTTRSRKFRSLSYIVMIMRTFFLDLGDDQSVPILLKHGHPVYQRLRFLLGGFSDGFLKFMAINLYYRTLISSY